MEANSLDYKHSFYLGIDPGESGGLAILDYNGSIIDASPMPNTEHDCAEYFREFAPQIRMAHIEAVHAMPKQGVSSSFKFGMSFGALRMALVAFQIPFEAVSPMAWQKRLGATLQGRKTASQDKTAKKNANKARAQQLFPTRKVTHAIADALLLAEDCRREFIGRIPPRTASATQTLLYEVLP